MLSKRNKIIILSSIVVYICFILFSLSKVPALAIDKHVDIGGDDSPREKEPVTLVLSSEAATSKEILITRDHVSALNLFLVVDPTWREWTDDVYLRVSIDSVSKQISLRSVMGNNGEIVIPFDKDVNAGTYLLELSSSSDVNITMKEASTTSTPYNVRHAIVIISFLFFFILTLATCKSQPIRRRKNRHHGLSKNQIILIVYLAVFIFSIFKVSYYDHSMYYPYDESEQVSYILHLEKTGNLVPKFGKIFKLDFNDKGENVYYAYKYGWDTYHIDDLFGTQFSKEEYNQFTHPPLYFQLIKLLTPIQIDSNTGDMHYSIAWMRLASQCIGYLALLISFYIGYTRLSRDKPIMHLLYAMIMTSVPLVLFGMTGVQNDTLLFLSNTIAILGILRFVEGKRGYFTFQLMTLGVSISVLTKLTGGLLSVTMIIALLILSLIKEKNLYYLKSKEIYLSLLIFIFPAAYYIYLYANYHTINPNGIPSSAYVNTVFSSIFASRRQLSLLERFISGNDTFFSAFSTINEVNAIGNTHSYDLTRISILLIPTLVFAYTIIQKKGKLLRNQGFFAGTIGIISWIVMYYMHFIKAMPRGMISGYLGGLQPRYYMSIITIIALYCAKIIESIDQPSKSVNISLNDKRISISYQSISIGVAALWLIGLFYDDFIYTLLTFKNYI